MPGLMVVGVEPTIYSKTFSRPLMTLIMLLNLTLEIPGPTNNEAGYTESSKTTGGPLKILIAPLNSILTMLGFMFIEVSLTECSKTISRRLMTLTGPSNWNLITPLFLLKRALLAYGCEIPGRR